VRPGGGERKGVVEVGKGRGDRRVNGGRGWDVGRGRGMGMGGSGGSGRGGGKPRIVGGEVRERCPGGGEGGSREEEGEGEVGGES